MKIPPVLKKIKEKKHYTKKKGWPMWEELVHYKARNVINNPLVGRQNTLCTAAHQAWLYQSIHQSSRQGWQLLAFATLFQD